MSAVLVVAGLCLGLGVLGALIGFLPLARPPKRTVRLASSLSLILVSIVLAPIGLQLSRQGDDFVLLLALVTLVFSWGLIRSPTRP